jgi:hypothetical protein
VRALQVFQRLIILFTISPVPQEEDRTSIFGARSDGGAKSEAVSQGSGRAPLLSVGAASDMEAQRGSESDAVRPAPFLLHTGAWLGAAQPRSLTLTGREGARDREGGERPTWPAHVLL